MSNWLSGTSLAALALALPPIAAAQDTAAPADSIDERLRRIEEELERQRLENASLRRELDVSREAPEGSAAEAGGRPGPQGGLFSKPFLARAGRRATLGGYIDLEYFDAQDQNRRFTQHRFIPFIYADVTDQLRVAAEIEFEGGGASAEAGDGETKVEFAFLDYAFHEAIGFRAGAILVPLGRFNLNHDSPVNDLTDRPLVDQFVIPTTLTEAGLGFTGTLYPFSWSRSALGDWELRYEAYLLNGFRGLIRDSSAPTGFRSLFDESNGLRDGRASLKVDSNNSVAGSGRVSISPFLGSEIGASFHAGKYDDRGEDWLVVWAIDGLLKPGRFWEPLTPLEILGEIASAEIERGSLARASGVPGNVWGAYGQLNYHIFPPACVPDCIPWVFKKDSHFTAVFRFDHVEMGSNRLQRLTPGLNFRPIEDTVFKFDYQINLEDWSHREVRNDAFVFSVATYF